jgi:hypothetical protein
LLGLEASFGPCRRSSSILQTRGRVLVRPRARDHLAARGVRAEPDSAAHSPPLRLGTRAVLTPPSRLATVAGFSERSLHEQSLVSPNERRERGAGAPRLLVAHRAARAAHGRVLGELCGVGRQASGPRRLSSAANQFLLLPPIRETAALASTYSSHAACAHSHHADWNRQMEADNLVAVRPKKKRRSAFALC